MHSQSHCTAYCWLQVWRGPAKGLEIWPYPTPSQAAMNGTSSQHIPFSVSTRDNTPAVDSPAWIAERYSAQRRCTWLLLPVQKLQYLGHRDAAVSLEPKLGAVVLQPSKQAPAIWIRLSEKGDGVRLELQAHKGGASLIWPSAVLQRWRVRMCCMRTPTGSVYTLLATWRPASESCYSVGEACSGWRSVMHHICVRCCYLGACLTML